MSECRAATKTQLFPRCPSAGRRKPLSASRASPPHRDEFVLTRQSWSYPLTSCVSLNCSTLQIHLQSQLQLSKALFHLKQPTAIQAGLPPALLLCKPTVPVPEPPAGPGSPPGMAGTGQYIPVQAQAPALHFFSSLALAIWCCLIRDTR